MYTISPVPQNHSSHQHQPSVSATLPIFPTPHPYHPLHQSTLPNRNSIQIIVYQRSPSTPLKNPPLILWSPCRSPPSLHRPFPITFSKQKLFPQSKFQFIQLKKSKMPAWAHNSGTCISWNVPCIIWNLFIRWGGMNCGHAEAKNTTT